jgi:phosphoribosylformylglycinamidine cyclo-ligase
MSSQTYRTAGVDREAAAEAKERLSRHARSTFTPGVLGDIGGFGSLFRLSGFRDPVLVSHTDGVGTKLRIGALMDRFEGLGEDLVHHCVNDILTTGARPLFFLDYIGTGKLVPQRVERLVQGMAGACRPLGCALIGGETAELPGIYQGDDFDLVGFAVGAVERDELIDGRKIQAGDLLLGLPSSGLHTNGYSLVRRLFDIDAKPGVLSQEFPELGTSLGEALVVPHRCYYLDLAPVMGHVKGMAHITGGGFTENVPRVLPPNLAARFRLGAWGVPPIFHLIQERGSVSQEEMFRVFNMGIGMVLVAGPQGASAIQAAVPQARVIGQVEERSAWAPVALALGEAEASGQ